MIGAAKLNNDLSFCKVTVCASLHSMIKVFLLPPLQKITKNEMKVDTSPMHDKAKK
jgi:hypothetical protein